MYIKCSEQCMTQNKHYMTVTIIIIILYTKMAPLTHHPWETHFYFNSQVVKTGYSVSCVTACWTKDTHFPESWLRLEVHSVVMEQIRVNWSIQETTYSNSDLISNVFWARQKTELSEHGLFIFAVHVNQMIAWYSPSL